MTKDADIEISNGLLFLDPVNQDYPVCDPVRDIHTVNRNLINF